MRFALRFWLLIPRTKFLMLTGCLLATAGAARGQTYTASVHVLTPPAAVTNLNVNQSVAFGNQAFSYGWGADTNSHNHAIVWTGPNFNVVDLTNPASYVETMAMGTDSVHQVGTGIIAGNHDHAGDGIVVEISLGGRQQF